MDSHALRALKQAFTRLSPADLDEVLAIVNSERERRKFIRTLSRLTPDELKKVWGIIRQIRRKREALRFDRLFSRLIIPRRNGEGL